MQITIITSVANNYEVVIDKNSWTNENIGGPKGQPADKIIYYPPEGIHGGKKEKPIEIDHHKFGHKFSDSDPPREMDPHYHGKNGQHNSYPKKRR